MTQKYAYVVDSQAFEPDGAVVMSALHGRARVFTTLQAAINAADEDATIFVRPGTYKEDITFLGDKQITLRGE